MCLTLVILLLILFSINISSKVIMQFAIAQFFHKLWNFCTSYIANALRSQLGKSDKTGGKINTAKHHWRWSFQLFPVHCLSDDRCIFRLSSLQKSP